MLAETCWFYVFLKSFPLMFYNLVYDITFNFCSSTIIQFTVLQKLFICWLIWIWTECSFWSENSFQERCFKQYQWSFFSFNILNIWEYKRNCDKVSVAQNPCSYFIFLIDPKQTMTDTCKWCVKQKNIALYLPCFNFGSPKKCKISNFNIFRLIKFKLKILNLFY